MDERSEQKLRTFPNRGVLSFWVHDGNYAVPAPGQRHVPYRAEAAFL
jgi:hypothetical protein